MSDISTANLKEWGMEIGEGIWGTVQGAFNERQTTSQIIVDAAIGMIPLVGDVTAARDLLAVTIRLIQEPQRRTQVMEWTLLVILIFALIPVIGGAIKGVGRLALKVGKNVAENQKILAQIISFLNRLGHGNAIKWFKELNVLLHEKMLIGKFKNFCEGIAKTISEILKSQLGKLLPAPLRATLIKIQDGLLVLKDMGNKYIPEGLKELHAKLKVLQEMVYQGEVHMLATGQKNLTREVEAYLLEKEIRAAIKAGKWSQNLVEPGTDPKTLRKLDLFFDRSKTPQGWPDLLRRKVKLPGLADIEYYNSLCTFSGKIAAWNVDDFAGKTIYRSFGNEGKLAGESNAAGYFWGVGPMPASAKEWRISSAVLDEWNANGLIVLVTFPSVNTLKKEKELEAALKGWFGRIAEQFGDKIKNQYLAGGGHQVGLGALPSKLEETITQLGNAAKKGSGGGKAEVMGVKIEVKTTGWGDVEGKYGYAEAGDDLSQYAPNTRRLDIDEIKPKIQPKASNSKTTAVARTSNQEEKSK